MYPGMVLYGHALDNKHLPYSSAAWAAPDKPAAFSFLAAALIILPYGSLLL